MPTESTRDIAMKGLKECSQFSGNYKLDEDTMDRFLSLCDLVDILGDEFGTENVMLEIKPEAQCGEIFFETDEFIFKNGCSHPFFEYIKATDFLSISKAKSGMLKIRIGVKDLWVKR